MAKRKNILISTSTRREGTRLMIRAIAAYGDVSSTWRIYIDDDMRAASDTEWLFSKEWDGIVLNSSNQEIAKQCQSRGIPCIDINDETGSIPGIPKIRPDNAGLGHIAAEHLRDRGFRRFAYCGFSDQKWAQERKNGFREAVELMDSPIEVFETAYQDSENQLRPKTEFDWHRNETESISQWLKTLKTPVGIMACNDLRAVQIIDACIDLEARLPDDFAIIGGGNEAFRCEIRQPSISSVPVNFHEHGRCIARTMQALLNKEADVPAEQLIEPTDAILRQSSDALAIDDPIVERAVRVLRDANGIGITVDQLAKAASSSRSQLERGFRKYFGHSPQTEIRQCQIAYIKSLLTGTDMTLYDIALVLGFKHPEYMSVVFKKLTGESPGVYRERMAET